jgi:two-component system CheB/CheR fusion protein
MKKKSPLHPTAGEAAALGSGPAEAEPPAVVVGIGAATGTLKSLHKLLAGIPSGLHAAFVLIHHPASAKRNPVQLLKGQTAMEVVEAADGMAVLAGRIYVMPPERFLSIVQNRLILTAPVHCDGLLMPIDHFFCALAADRRKRCAGILLSGDGSDGTLGLSEIRAAGGRTLREGSRSGAYSGMLSSASNAGEAGMVLPAEAMAEAVIAIIGQMIEADRRAPAVSPETEAGMQSILDTLHARVGHDFSCYKLSTLIRRIHRRMALGGITSMDGYARHLPDHPDEVALLQKDLLIGVTDFFRQPQAWETLERKVIAPLMENAAPGLEVRVWVPGCSSAKEVYSLAMLLTEQAERTGSKAGFQIFATDANPTALAEARKGSYAAADIGENVSAERLNRFFSERDGYYQVIKSIRERIVFATQNITADPPFSRMDLIICRNLLIYLDQQVQRKIIILFHYALRDGGFLFLGNAETIGDREDLFEPVSKKWRIYRRIGVGHRVSVEIPARPAGELRSTPLKSPAAMTPRLSLTSIAKQVLLDRFAPACVIIDRKLQVLYAHGMIENYLTIPGGELTTRVVDMAREGLRARLRGAIGKCIETGRVVSFIAHTRRGAKSVPVKASVSPLRHLRDADGLLLITFEDQRFPAAKSGSQPAGEDAHQLANELKITREELQSTIDQLEGSNDQLKASNEEVMAANEELQSANEEMETSKEELQSLNEELNTINLRLQEKVDELESTNNDVVNLLSSASIATVFLDKQLRVKRFTPAVDRLMGLIASDTGRPISDVLLRFTDEALLEDAHHVLADLTPRSREVRADDGRWYIRRIMPYRTQDDRIEGVVVTFVDVADLKQVEEALREAHKRAEWLARFPDESPAPVIRASAEGTILYCNPAAMCNREWACNVGDPIPDPVRPLVASAMASGEELSREIQLGRSFYAVTLAPFPADAYVNIYGRDITKRRHAEEEIRRSEERLNRAQEIAHLGSWELDLIENRLIWSDEVYRIFGLQPQEFAATYQAFIECVHPDDREAVNEAYSASLRENRDTYEIEHRVIRRHTGEIRFVHERCHHFRDKEGMIIRSGGMVHDITDRKRAEQALRQSEQRVRRKLQSILSPEGEIGELELADLIDVPVIQSLMDNFHALAPIPMSMIDLEGNVLVGVGWSDICVHFHRVHPETRRHCRESDTMLSSGILPGEPRLYKCRNNMWDIAAPIMVGKKHVGNVFSGQFFFTDEPLDYECFRSQARQYGFDEEAYLAALERVPRLTRQDVKTGMAFFMQLAGLISQLSYSNIKLARSLSERDALMDSLRESEERLQLFIEHAPAALAMFDREMRYLSMSSRWRRDYGLGDRALIGISPYDIFPEISAEWREAHGRGLAGEVLRAEADRFKRADGSVQWVQWEIRPWYDAAGSVGGIVIFSEDITERKQAEQMLENRSKQLEAANKELESFSYSVSHDLRAPLRAIDGFSRMILRKGGDKLDEEARRRFDAIRDNAQMMGQLIDDLLAFSRIGRTEPSRVMLDMDLLIRNVWKELTTTSPGKHPTLKMTKIPPCKGDRALIKQVFINILSNAVKFTRPREEALIEAGGYAQGSECVYYIRDNGVGFDMQYHDKLFGVFQRLHTSDEFEGTGVGLAIVQRVIHRHGGRVWAESRMNEGTTFYVTLPMEGV